MRPSWRAGVTIRFCVLLVVAMAAASATRSQAEESLATADLGEIDRKLNNPLTDLWSMTLQNNTFAQTGDALGGKEYSNNLFFQPFMPFEFGPEKQVMLTLRPVFPLVTQPVFDSDPRNSSGHETGLGDIQLLMLAGPNTPSAWVWGAGATFVFPSATKTVLGQGKYQAGPAAMLFHIGRPWVAGLLAQHWQSFAGDADRADVQRTDVQYTIRYSLPQAMSIGMGPTVSYDWEADADNALTLPVGLGVTRTVRWGATPIKLRAEMHYSVVKPQDYGEEWNFRIQITPVIPNPLK